jgi:hypothetical protein
MMHSPHEDEGGELPRAGALGAPPLPVAIRIEPGASELNPTPACHTPAPSPVVSDTQRALI